MGDKKLLVSDYFDLLEMGGVETYPFKKFIQEYFQPIRELTDISYIFLHLYHEEEEYVFNGKLFYDPSKCIVSEIIAGIILNIINARGPELAYWKTLLNKIRFVSQNSRVRNNEECIEFLTNFQESFLQIHPIPTGEEPKTFGIAGPQFNDNSKGEFLKKIFSLLQGAFKKHP